MGFTSFSLRWRCKKGAVVFAFAPKPGTNPFNDIAGKEPEILLRLTTEIQIVIEPPARKRGRISARFLPQECVELLSKQWPCDANFDQIATAVRERKHYPMPKVEIPGGGGKSATAQGQTKKPGSHSQDKHR